MPLEELVEVEIITGTVTQDDPILKGHWKRGRESKEKGGGKQKPVTRWSSYRVCSLVWSLGRFPFFVVS